MSYDPPRLSTAKLLGSFVVTALLVACGNDAPAPAAQVSTAPPGKSFTMVSIDETDPVETPGPGANDVAIWVDPVIPGQSLIIGTDTEKGLMVYSLDGQRHQFLEHGMPYNVDVRSGFELGGRQVSIGAFTDQNDNTIGWFTITADGIVFQSANPTPMKPHGLCLGRSAGQLLAIVTYKPGLVEVYRVNANGDEIAMSLLSSHRLKSRTESCVFDDERDVLYVSEENVAVWRFTRDGDNYLNAPVQMDVAGGSNGLEADIEGLAIYRGEREYLIAGSQGNDQFAMYELAPPNAFLGSFRIVPGETLNGPDRVQASDGIEVVATPLPGYPDGLLVVQDDDNGDKNQNFKFLNADFSALQN